ncbi:MAG TPA: hypothetical protein VGL06_12985, partial [Pseudonocardiaceae bacterium]
PVLNVTMKLSAPAGYSAKATSATHFGSVPGGRTVHTTYTVDSPQATLFASAVFTTTDSYTQLHGGTTSSTESHPLTVHSQLQAPYRSYSSTTGMYAQSGSGLGIAGQGADIWGSVNEYSTIYLPAAEKDGTVATVEVAAQQNTAPWAKAGIIVRNDVTGANTAPGYVLLAETPGNGYILDWDANGDGQLDSQSGGTTTAAYPSWLKLVRSGTTFTGYYSTDDAHWTLVGTASVPTAAATQDVGVAMTSHSAHVTGEVDFDHFTVSAAG